MSEQQEKLKAIADKIREKTGEIDLIKPNDFVNKIEDVYNKGVSDGKQSQYDEFWDSYQDFGNRMHYGQAFGGKGWNKNTFKPKYDIKPKISSTHMFRDGLEDIPNGDLVEYLANLNPPIQLDFSQCTSFIETFYYTTIKRVGVIDTRSANSVNGTFGHMSVKGLETIDLLILRDDGSQTFTATTFTGANNLKNITIQGVIGQPNITLKDFKLLTKASIKSFIDALSPNTSGLSITFSKTAVNNAFGIDIDDETTYPEGSEYYNLRNSKNNWTFNYI